MRNEAGDIIKNRKYQMHEKAYWDTLKKGGTAINLKYARDLSEDVPEFISKSLVEFETDVTEFCFDGSSGLILDAGCGNGNILMHAQELFPENSINYIGLDLSKNMLSLAATRAIGKLNISFLQGSITDLPFDDNTFDQIICSGVLTLLGSLGEVEEALIEFYRILKPGGVLVIDFFNRCSPMLMAWSIFHRPPPPPPPRSISPFWFTKRVEKVGFKISSYRGYDFKPISGYLFMSRWKFLDPMFMQERFSRFIEQKIMPYFPILSVVAFRVYLKCIKPVNLQL